MNATEEIFPAYRRATSAAITRLNVLVLLNAISAVFALQDVLTLP